MKLSMGSVALLGRSGTTLGAGPLAAGESSGFSEDLLFEFLNDYYRIDGEVIDAATAFSCGRNSTGTNVDSSGDIENFTANTARLTDVSLLIEEASTNYVNNTRIGATEGTIGSSGAYPTGWVIEKPGLAVEVEFVTAKGQPAVKLKFSGTTTNANGIAIYFSSTTDIDALTTETWANSAYLAVNNITSLNAIRLRIRERLEAGGNVKIQDSGDDIKGDLTSSVQRFEYVETLDGGGNTAHAQPGVVIGVNSGVDLDAGGGFEITILLNQFEENDAVTSPILTGTTPVTRADDDITLALGANTYDLTVTDAEGGTTALTDKTGNYELPNDLGDIVKIEGWL